MRVALVLHLGSDREALRFGLHLLTIANVRHLREAPSTPALYETSVRYRMEERDESGHRKEDWRSIPETLEHGHGDCEDLAAWRAAELIAAGEDARADCVPSGPGWHAIVVRGSGRIEDPSKRLGMGTGG